MKDATELKTSLEKQISASQWPGYVYGYPHKQAFRLDNCMDMAKVWDGSVKELNLYIHIPFCEGRCAYCNLFTLPIGRRKKVGNAEYIDTYIDAMLRQVEYYKQFFDNPKIFSLYFGGGTPNYLSIEQLSRIMDALKNAFPDWKEGIEPCIECSPYLLDEEYINGLKRLGFRRISMGMQSFDDEDLKIMNRLSKPTTLIDVYNLVKKAGLNTNVDIIYGLPGQAMGAMLKNLNKVIGLTPKPENISLYPLVVRKLTGMDKMAKNDYEQRDEKYEFFNKACEILADNNYQWESSVRFSLIDGGSSYEQQSLEFQGVSTLGIGSGARSYAPNTNYAQPYRVQPKPTREILNTYINADFAKGIPFEVFNFCDDESKRKFIIFSLLKSKLNKVQYHAQFGEDPIESYPTEFGVLSEMNLVDNVSGWLNLTDKGRRFHDIVVNLFESKAVQELKEGYALS